MCTAAANKLTQALRKARFDQWEDVEVEEAGGGVEAGAGAGTDEGGAGTSMDFGLPADTRMMLCLRWRKPPGDKEARPDPTP